MDASETIETLNWMEKAAIELDGLSKEQLIQKIIQQRKKTFSETGKRNVSSSKTHERRCKQLLTDWSGTEFRRRRVEGRGDDVSVVEGVADVIPVRGEVHFAIESKKGDKFSLNGLFENPRGAVFTSWWHQVNYDAQLLATKTGSERWPFLFFKPHPNWDWVAVPTAVFERRVLAPSPDRRLEDQILAAHRNGIWFPALRFDWYTSAGPISGDISHSKKNPVIKQLVLLPCYLCRWKDFATYVDPQSFFVRQ